MIRTINPKLRNTPKSRNKDTRQEVLLFHLFHSQRDKFSFHQHWLSAGLLEREREGWRVNECHYCCNRWIKSVGSIFTFACGDRNVCDQGVQFVGGVLVLITLPGQPYAYPVRHVPAQHTTRLFLFSIKGQQNNFLCILASCSQENTVLAL